ncbi:MAG: hypothetical protein AB7O49_02985 [Sphingomonadales bacterium]
MNIHAISACALAALLAAPAPAMACRCEPRKDVATSLEMAEAVFLGRVVSMRELETVDGNTGVVTRTQAVDFVVEKGWKNARTGERKHFLTSDPGSNCTKWFVRTERDAAGEPTDRWIVYARGKPPYHFPSCSRSHRLTPPSSINDEPALDALTTPQ